MGFLKPAMKDEKMVRFEAAKEGEKGAVEIVADSRLFK